MTRDANASRDISGVCSASAKTVELISVMTVMSMAVPIDEEMIQTGNEEDGRGDTLSVSFCGSLRGISFMQITATATDGRYARRDPRVLCGMKCPKTIIRNLCRSTITINGTTA